MFCYYCAHVPKTEHIRNNISAYLNCLSDLAILISKTWIILTNLEECQKNDLNKYHHE